jgi:hypothetical protein
MKLRLAASAAGSVLMLGACAEGPKTDDFGYEGTGIQFSVAPLTLDALADACYSFAITNEANPPQLVVGRGPGAQAAFGGLSTTEAQTLCASQFGNTAGGEISYVAPCDADEDFDGDGAAEHTVYLWVDALCEAAVTDKAGTANWDTANAPAPNGDSGICNEIQAYQNPCGDAGCQLTVTCEENADTPVTFNFTIMGQADQGFFDIAVNFEDIFCSAKVDCQRAEGDVNTPIELLHNPYKPGSPRDLSFIVARACTAGPGETTQMYSSPTYLVCGNDYRWSLTDTISYGFFYPSIAFIFNPQSAAEGNQGLANLVALIRLPDGQNDGDWSFASPADTLSLFSFFPNPGAGNFQSFDVTSAAFTDPPPAGLGLSPVVFQNAVYHGNEALEDAGGTNLGKVYWNHAVGVDWAAFNGFMDWVEVERPDLILTTPIDAPPLRISPTQCRIISNVIATDADGLPPAPVPLLPGPFDPGYQPSSYESHPSIYSEVTFWQAGDPTDTLRCTQHPLLGGGAKGGVRPVYTSLYYGMGLNAGAPVYYRPWGQSAVSFSPYCMQGDGQGSTLLTICP